MAVCSGIAIVVRFGKMVTPACLTALPSPSRLAFMVCLALSMWAKEKSRPETSEPPGPPTVQGIVGYPKEVDAVANLTAARTLTKRPALRGIVLDSVASDGSLDFTESVTRARYTFQSSAGHSPDSR